MSEQATNIEMLIEAQISAAIEARQIDVNDAVSLCADLTAAFISRVPRKVQRRKMVSIVQSSLPDLLSDILEEKQK